jgi:hypothetical protein
MDTAVQAQKIKKPLRSLWRWAAVVAFVCLAVWVTGVVYVDWAMRQTPERFGRVMARMPMVSMMVLPFETLWTHERAGHLNQGDQAPAFTLKQLQGGEAPVEMFSLWKERPVVLVFGSYT